MDQRGRRDVVPRLRRRSGLLVGKEVRPDNEVLGGERRRVGRTKEGERKSFPLFSVFLPGVSPSNPTPGPSPPRPSGFRGWVRDGTPLFPLLRPSTRYGSGPGQKRSVGWSECPDRRLGQFQPLMGDKQETEGVSNLHTHPSNNGVERGCRVSVLLRIPNIPDAKS